MTPGDGGNDQRMREEAERLRPKRSDVAAEGPWRPARGTCSSSEFRQSRRSLETVALVMQKLEAVPTASELWQPRNLLLRALPANELSKLRPHLETVSLARGSIVFDANQPLTRVHFVEAGLVPLLAVFEKRVTAAAAAVGREGAIGLATLLLGGESALGRYQVLLPGSALSLEISQFRAALRESPKLKAVCEAFAQALLVQILQAVSCGRSHTMEQRCARWLLMCADQNGDDAFELSQQSLADILGVPQPTVVAIACELQRDGLISYRHGALTGFDRPRLEATACECYHIVGNRLQRLFKPLRPTGGPDPDEGPIEGKIVSTGWLRCRPSWL